MPTTLQFRRGTTSQNNSFTGALGEISVDTDKDTIRVHDGSTAGGFEIVQTTATQTLTNKSIDASQLTGTIADARIASSSITQHQANITGTGALNSGSITSGFGSIDVGSSTIATTGAVTLDSITKAGTTGVGNIGASGQAFNTVFAKATSAQYADLAEKYLADQPYAPGTVLIIGGSAEVTACNKYADSSSAGIVSTHPAYLMNSSLEDANSVELALTGRVPCRVVGDISKGDLLTTSEIEGTATRLMPDSFVPGCVIGKSLEDYNSTEPGIIEVIVGKV